MLLALDTWQGIGGAEMSPGAETRSWSEAMGQMEDQAKKSEPGVPGERLAPQLRMMVQTFLDSPVRNTLFALGIAIFAVIALTAFGQIKLNAWNKPFRAHLAAACANHDVHLATTLHTARYAARRACLSCLAIPVPEPGIRGCAEADRAWPSVAVARSRRALGPGIDQRGTAKARLVPTIAAQAALGIARRSD